MQVDQSCRRICNVYTDSPLFCSEISAEKQKHINCDIHKGSYMSARIILNLLNELGKRDKMRGLQAFYLFFRNEFNKFNNT